MSPKSQPNIFFEDNVLALQTDFWRNLFCGQSILLPTLNQLQNFTTKPNFMTPKLKKKKSKAILNAWCKQKIKWANPKEKTEVINRVHSLNS